MYCSNQMHMAWTFPFKVPYHNQIKRFIRKLVPLNGITIFSNDIQKFSFYQNPYLYCTKSLSLTLCRRETPGTLTPALSAVVGRGTSHATRNPALSVPRGRCLSSTQRSAVEPANHVNIKLCSDFNSYCMVFHHLFNFSLTIINKLKIAC